MHAYRHTEERDLYLTLILPDERLSNGRAAMFLHGGGWWTGSPSQLRPQAEEFSAQGFVSVLVEYRLHGRDSTGIADAIDDAAAAYQWIVDNAIELQVRKGDVILVGASAGGHLALALALEKAVPISGLWLLNPVIDLISASPESGFSDGEIMLIASLDNRQRRALSFSERLSDLSVPTLIQFGTEDPLWRRWGDLLTELGAAGGPILVSTTSDAGHGYFNASPYLQQTTAKATEFFAAGALHPN